MPCNSAAGSICYRETCSCANWEIHSVSAVTSWIQQVYNKLPRNTVLVEYTVHNSEREIDVFSVEVENVMVMDLQSKSVGENKVQIMLRRMMLLNNSRQ